MKTISLPAQLKDGPELDEHNSALRSWKASFDWSAVEEVEPGALKRLLRDVDLSTHDDALGLGSIPEAIQEAVEAVLLGAGAEAEFEDDDEDLGSVAPSKGVRPAVYSFPMEGGEEVVRDRAVPKPPVAVAPPKAAGPQLKAPPAHEIRAELLDLLRADLLGPRGGEEEEIAEGRPRDQYLVGLLAPKDVLLDIDAEDDASRDDDTSKDDGGDDAETVTTHGLWPSSTGMTFSVERSAKMLRLNVRFGVYERIPSDKLFDEEGKQKLVWRRQPVTGQWDLPLKAGMLPRWAPHDDNPDVWVEGIVRDRDDEWSVTLFLVNGQTQPKKLADTAWVFQPWMRVEGVDGEPVLRCRPHVSASEDLDPKAAMEQQTLSMLYRHQLEFAVGHGTAVKSSRSKANPFRADAIETDILPAFEVEFQESPAPSEVEGLSGLRLDMQALATMPKADLMASLRHLPTAYELWIEAQEKRLADGIDDLDAHRDAGERALKLARRALARVREGIDVLEEDETALAAFRFANEAMAHQRIRSKYAEARRRKQDVTLEGIDVEKNRSWRVFQLGFLLLNVPALADVHHPDRSPDAEAMADLLWFPTGGGKTEAYLGVAAFTMGIRRLQGMVAGRSGRDGIAVLMRYTLRLLTIQQFQRASALICACEVLRRKDPDKWGQTPFRIGLWVGHRTTPNTTDRSHEAIKQVHDTKGYMDSSGGGSPVQLKHCPWCGTVIDPGKHITVETGSKGVGRTFMYCGDKTGSCEFSPRLSPREGIPVVVVDEEIYKLLPALVIATVDKFAQLPWRGATQMLFGGVNERCPRHGFIPNEDDHPKKHNKSGRLPKVTTEETSLLRPPDLIIQDELHLISGPLGTLVGLYETVIDELATWTVQGKQVRPKVIASTATIRRADEQIRALFHRTVAVFPPNGLDSTDNFFSRRLPKEKRPGRIYLGVCAPGRRVKSTQIRLFTTLLAASQKLFDKYGGAVDPWMTAVGYYNSIRELAGARRAVEDDVKNRLRDTDRRGLAKRKRIILEELTSRKKSSEIPEILDRMEIAHKTPDPKDKDRKIPYAQRPLDVLLATNMISVGVDVGRLGVMLTAGQPKTTAEYIQATSRVGRNTPGLVCTVYNWARPRDLSHYENFESYHATFYRHVEALSLTPFATRALDRALFALLVSLVRHDGFDFNDNLGAGRVTPATQLALDVIERIAARGEGVTHSKVVGEEIRKRLKKRWDRWLELKHEAKAGQAQLGYKSARDGTTVGLLRRAEDGDWDETTCLNSLREVEPPVGLVLLDSQMDDLPEFGAES